VVGMDDGNVVRDENFLVWMVASAKTYQSRFLVRHVLTDEIKYLLSNAGANAALEELLRAAFARHHVEKWFERAKQECGLGAFEVRTYQSLIRHWLCVSLAMLFLTEQTTRLRGEKSTDHLRAGGSRGQHPDDGLLQPLLAFMV